MLRTRIPLVLAAGVVLAGAMACSDGEDDDSTGGAEATPVTTSIAEGPGVPAIATTPSLAPTGGATTSITPPIAPTGDPTAAGAPCELYEEPWFVWGVSTGDVLNVRAGPGVTNPIVATLLPDAVGVRACYDFEDIDDSIWRAVAIDGEMGWVNVRFLKPEGADPLDVVGEVRPRLRAASEAVRSALVAADFELLAEFCDDDPVLTCANLRDAAADDTVILWGSADGTGFPIEMTIAERLREIAGSWALTSTDVLAFDVRVGVGNTIDNLAEAMPGAAFVEYHASGTSRFSGLDWASVRFIFDTSGEDSPVLLAVVEDMWTI